MTDDLKYHIEFQRLEPKITQAPIRQFDFNKIKRQRVRILFARPNEERGITHWIFNAEPKHKPILYACAHFAFYKDGRIIESYQTNKEFD